MAVRPIRARRCRYPTTDRPDRAHPFRVIDVRSAPVTRSGKGRVRGW
jgi:hypothetical protein